MIYLGFSAIGIYCKKTIKLYVINLICHQSAAATYTLLSIAAQHQFKWFTLCFYCIFHFWILVIQVNCPDNIFSKVYYNEELTKSNFLQERLGNSGQECFTIGKVTSWNCVLEQMTLCLGCQTILYQGKSQHHVP